MRHNKSDIVSRKLIPHCKYLVRGQEMFFYYWDNEVPVFYYYVEGEIFYCRCSNWGSKDIHKIEGALIQYIKDIHI